MTVVRLACGLMLGAVGCSGSVTQRSATKCGELGRIAWRANYGDRGPVYDPNHDPIDSAALADVNGDGYRDVLVQATQLEQVVGYAGGPQGLVSQSSWATKAAQFVRGEACFATGDVNGDGFTDLAVCGVRASRDGVAVPAIYLGSAAGLPAIPSMTLGDRPEAAHSIAFEDVNCDGRQELVLGRTEEHSIRASAPYYAVSAEVFQWTGLTLRSERVVSVPGFSGQVVAMGDITGDGCGEIAIVSRTSDVILPGDARLGISLFQGSASGLSTTVRWFAGHGVNGVGSPWDVERSRSAAGSC